MTLSLASRIALFTGASRRGLAAAARGGGDESDAGGEGQGHGRREIRKDGGSMTLVPLNLTDFDGIARLGAALHERHGRHDILVGNAGVAGPSSPLGHIELK